MKKTKNLLNELEARAPFKPNNKEYYTGLTEGTLRERINTHLSNFRLPNYSTVTALAKYIWKLKKYKYEYSIKWSILANAKTYNPATKLCNLCNKEKYFIIFKPEISTLIQNNELLKKCVHRAKFIIGNWMAQKNLFF